MTDVPHVAVAEQINEVFARRIRVCGKEPAVQSNAVGSLEVHVLKRAAQLAPACLQLAVRLINLAMFKPAQHKISNRQPKKQAGPSAAQTSWLPAGHTQDCHEHSRKASLRYGANLRRVPRAESADKSDPLQTLRARGQVNGRRVSVWSACVFSAALARKAAIRWPGSFMESLLSLATVHWEP